MPRGCVLHVIAQELCRLSIHCLHLCSEGHTANGNLFDRTNFEVLTTDSKNRRRASNGSTEESLAVVRTIQSRVTSLASALPFL